MANAENLMKLYYRDVVKPKAPGWSYGDFQKRFNDMPGDPSDKRKRLAGELFHGNVDYRNQGWQEFSQSVGVGEKPNYFMNVAEGAEVRAWESAGNFMWSVGNILDSETFSKAAENLFSRAEIERGDVVDGQYWKRTKDVDEGIANRLVNLAADSHALTSAPSATFME